LSFGIILFANPADALEDTTRASRREGHSEKEARGERHKEGLVKASPPFSLAFVFFTILAAVLGASLYDSYRNGSASYHKFYPRVLRYPSGLPDIRWRLKTVTYRRATEPFMYWLSIALTGFGFVVCTLGAALSLFVTIVSW
jgi:hypothetical protein